MNNLCKCIYCSSVSITLVLANEILSPICDKCQPDEPAKHVAEEIHWNNTPQLPVILLSGSVASSFSFLS